MTQRLFRVLTSGTLLLAATAFIQAQQPHSMHTHKGWYVSDQTVEFRFFNVNNGNIALASSSPLVFNSTGQLVYPPPTAQTPLEVQPTWHDFEWDQIGNDGKRVAPGLYTARITVTAPDSMIVETPPFRLLGNRYEGVSLFTPQCVYKAGVPGQVALTLSNNSPGLVVLSAASWKVMDDELNDTLFQSSGTSISLAPGQTLPLIWDKKDSNGQFVSPGTYTVEVGPMTLSGGASFLLYRTIALTPSGRIAGTQMYPLYNDNQWVYSAEESSQEKTKVLTQSPPGFVVRNLVGATRKAKMVGTTVPTLTVSSGWGDLFQFHRPLNDSYSVNVKPYLVNAILRVGALKATVDTPLGKFVGCYRLDVVSPGSVYGSFWFAPGIGLVQYTKKGKTFSLERSRIAGTDGAWYTIGLPWQDDEILCSW